MSTEGAVPRALILTGDGINCEVETAEAFFKVGFRAEVFHINDLVKNQMPLDRLKRDYRVLALPGGFSFGDDLASGKVLALKIQHGLKWDLGQFAKEGGMVLGVCNGFQALIRMGVFGKDVSITHNTSGKFINKWVRVIPASQRCVWLRGMGAFGVPIRHGEGRIVLHAANRGGALNKLERQEMMALRYEGENPNGSEENLAGLCDPTGRILGLMPHPEAAVRRSAYPDWTGQASGGGADGEGLALFENAFHS